MHTNYWTGIQQIGIGISDVATASRWYRDYFGFTAQVFDDAGEAALMLPYTKNEVRSRRAILSLNMAGGGGFEIWQYTSRVPVQPSRPVRLGDFGIFAPKLKCPDISKAYAFLKSKNVKVTTPTESPSGNQTFWAYDLYNNPFHLVQSDDWFQKTKHPIGGICGAVMGVSDMDKSVAYYKEVLGFNQEIYHTSGKFSDLPEPALQEERFNRVLLKKVKPSTGAFSRLLGDTEIELVQATDYSGEKIFAGRDWGDTGYIHICFDVLDMKGLQAHCNKHHSPFTVDSGETFDMGDSGGRFSYTEDPDGTLIEFVETHKVPIMKKFGLFLNLKNKQHKPLADWMVRLLGISKVK